MNAERLSNKEEPFHIEKVEHDQTDAKKEQQEPSGYPEEKDWEKERDYRCRYPWRVQASSASGDKRKRSGGE